MTGTNWHTFEEAEKALRVEIVFYSPGLRVFITLENYPAYQDDSIAYFAKDCHTTPSHVRRYIALAGTIRCRHIRPNGKQCRNQYGFHPAPGQIDLKKWLEIDASSWYCNRHTE